MTRPEWPPKDWRAIIALVASIAGAGVMTGFAAWLVWILWRGGWPVATSGQRIAALAWALLLVLSTVALILLGLGMAINRRAGKIKLPGGAEVEFSGGEEAALTAAASEAAKAAGADPVRRPSQPGEARGERRPAPLAQDDGEKP